MNPCYRGRKVYAVRIVTHERGAFKLVPSGQLPYRIALLHLVLGIRIDQVHHDLGDPGIELCSGPFYYLLAHDRLSNRSPVASVGGHRIVSIRHGYDPGYLRDILALPAFGIALSVITLMMVMGADAQIGVLTDARKDLVTHYGMLLDDVIFFRSQFSVLVDYGIIYTDLAYIMKKSGIVNLVAFLFAPS